MHERDNMNSETKVASLAQADLSERPAAVEHLPAPGGDRAAFLRGFLRHPGRVASVIPSSSQLERRLVRLARPAEAAVVLELGPGTGGTTRALLAAMRADARLLAIELEPAFHAHLSRNLRDPRFSAHLGSAEETEQTLAAYRLPAPEVVVSGIPFSIMPPEVADRIAAAISRVLAPGGRLVAYQVSAQVVNCVSPYLGTPQRQWEWLNIPPVCLFTWTKSQAPVPPVAAGGG